MYPSPRDIDINDYTYPLPGERIAQFPPARRDAAKLLVYQGGAIRDDTFRHLPQYLPEGALLLFNNTRVIHARLPFRRATGARIEVFCLEPVAPAGHLQSLSSEEPVTWKCLIGNNKRWKGEELVLPIETEQGTVHLSARRLGPVEDAFAVRFHWDRPGTTFGELLHAAGLIPLPPYLQRDNAPGDEQRYQTIYAQHEGSVAAPTAGLHFTERVLRDLAERNIQTQQVTLHVGAGTFRPVKSERLGDHYMHEEFVSVDIKAIKAIRQTIGEGKPVIPVGTTSLRTLESLYWSGCKVANQSAGAPPPAGKSENNSNPAQEEENRNPAPRIQMEVDQWTPYESATTLPAQEALDHLLDALEEAEQDQLNGRTRLLIAPGYRFRLAGGLITNFHQPRSTLLLLIAALIGDDWRRVYDYALDNDFRFLSYGDSSLLMPLALQKNRSLPKSRPES